MLQLCIQADNDKSDYKGLEEEPLPLYRLKRSHDNFSALDKHLSHNNLQNHHCE